MDRGDGDEGDGSFLRPRAALWTVGLHHSNRRLQCTVMTHIATSPAFEVIAKRRKGYPSETGVKRGLRFVRGGEKELLEKLGRNDPCPCGSGKRFQTVLPYIRPVSTRRSGTITGGEQECGGSGSAPGPTAPGTILPRCRRFRFRGGATGLGGHPFAGAENAVEQ